MAAIHEGFCSRHAYGQEPVSVTMGVEIMGTPIHKNLHSGLWTVGPSPVRHVASIIALDVILPDMTKSRNKAFHACLDGGRRKVFAQARARKIHSEGKRPPVSCTLRRICFNPTKGDRCFHYEGEKENILEVLNVVWFAPDGNAYHVTTKREV